MEQPPDQNCGRDQHQTEDLVAPKGLPLQLATRLGINFCEVRLGAGVNQGAILPERKAE